MTNTILITPTCDQTMPSPAVVPGSRIHASHLAPSPPTRSLAKLSHMPLSLRLDPITQSLLHSNIHIHIHTKLFPNSPSNTTRQSNRRESVVGLVVCYRLPSRKKTLFTEKAKKAGITGVGSLLPPPLLPSEASKGGSFDTCC